MKKLLISLTFLFACVNLFADNYEEFSIKILKAFPQAEYVSYDTYEKWNGDAEAFIKFYSENGQCFQEG